jgi:hypothetical protein
MSAAVGEKINEIMAFVIEWAQEAPEDVDMDMLFAAAKAKFSELPADHVEDVVHQILESILGSGEEGEFDFPWGMGEEGEYPFNFGEGEEGFNFGF